MVYISFTTACIVKRKNREVKIRYSETKGDPKVIRIEIPLETRYFRRRFFLAIPQRRYISTFEFSASDRIPWHSHPLVLMSASKTDQ